MDKTAILELALEKGLGDHLATVERALKPAIGLTLEAAEEGPLGASRFGGQPDLPKGVAWPTWQEVPMEFVGQIRLADVAPHDRDRLLPSTGQLFFFRSSQWEWSNFLDGDERFGPARVIYRPGDEGALERQPAPRVDYSDEYRTDALVPTVYTSARATASARLMLPQQTSAFAEELGVSEVDGWEDFMAEAAVAMADGPPATDEDPSPTVYDNHLLGYLGEPDHDDGMSTDDVLLLQVASDDAAGFTWGDDDHLYFVIAASDLKSRDFSRVRLFNKLG